MSETTGLTIWGCVAVLCATAFMFRCVGCVQRDVELTHAKYLIQATQPAEVER